MPWKRTPGTVRGINGRWKDRMETSLDAARKCGLEFSDTKFGKFQVMSWHAIEIDSSFTCHQTFFNWMNGKRKTVLPKSITSVVDSMFKKYVKK